MGGALMQCPDCKRLRHAGECPEPTDEEMREFFGWTELEKARELVGRAGLTPLKEDRHEPR